MLSTKFWRVNTPLTAKFRRSTPCTVPTWREWISIPVHQRCAHFASEGALLTASKTAKITRGKSVQFNTFRIIERGPHSSHLCSHCLRNWGLVPWTLLSLSWKTQPNWNQFKNKLPSDVGRELYHFLLHCFDIQIGGNMMAIQRNINPLKHWR